MQHLLRASTAKHERANDPLSHNKQALGNVRHSRYFEVTKLPDTKSTTVITTVSPQYPQTNGLVEKEVQIVKNLLTKAKQDRRDPYLGLLEYRNTPIDDIG